VPALAAPAVQATRRRGILSDRRGLNIFPRSGAVGPNRDIAPPVTSFENECESSSQSSRAVADAQPIPFGKKRICAQPRASAHDLPNGNFWADVYDKNKYKYLILPARPERFELMTRRLV
jgi:hypothetical protein